jgi:hypothetical protein
VPTWLTPTIPCHETDTVVVRVDVVITPSALILCGAPATHGAAIDIHYELLALAVLAALQDVAKRVTALETPRAV